MPLTRYANLPRSSQLDLSKSEGCEASQKCAFEKRAHKVWSSMFPDETRVDCTTVFRVGVTSDKARSDHR
jgi:hypothetical protein